MLRTDAEVYPEMRTQFATYANVSLKKIKPVAVVINAVAGERR